MRGKMNKLHIIKELMEKPKGFWDLLRNSNENGIEFINMINNLKGKDLEYKKNKFSIKDKARKKYTSLFKKDFKTEKKIFKRIIKQRPLPTDEFYQDFLSEKSIFDRIKIMHDLCDIQDKEICVLGDDDFFSAALGLTGIPRKITAFDVDERIVDALNDIGKKEKININSVRYDISKKPLEKFRKKYDLIVTEPVETLQGLKIWLSRCAFFLKKDGALYFGLTLVESPLKKWHEIQKMLNKMNFVITDIIRNHSYYPTNKNTKEYHKKIFKLAQFDIEEKPKTWYTSWLFRCEAVGPPKPIVKGSVKLRRSFYYDKYFLGQ